MESKVRVHVLENGLRVYSLLHGLFHCAGIGVRYGSLYERQRGIAHGMEHWLTQRSGRYPDPKEIQRLYRKYGGGSDGHNIYTKLSHTFYGHSDVRRRDYMRLLFDISASFVHPDTRMLELPDLPSEKAAMANEHFEHGKDVVDERLGEAVYRLIYKEGPLAEPIDGTLETIRSFTPAAAKRILHWIVPPNMFAVILGPTFEEAKRMGEKYFDDWEFDPAKAPVFRYPYPIVTRLDGVLHYEEMMPHLHQHHMLIGFPTETYLSRDAEAIDMLSSILKDRVEEILRDRNDDVDKGIYHVLADTERTFAHGILMVKIASRSADYIRYAEDVVAEEAKRLREKLIPEDEFIAARTHKLDEFLTIIRHHADGLCDLIADAAANGDPDLRRFHRTEERIKRVTQKKLRGVANRYLNPKGYARAVIRPAS